MTYLSTAVMWSKSKSDVEFQYGGRLIEFNGMSSQSHVSHCRVLPLGEFTVTILELHATLQGVRIPSAILKIVLRHILFFWVLMHFKRLSYRLRYTCLVWILATDRQTDKQTDRRTNRWTAPTRNVALAIASCGLIIRFIRRHNTARFTI